MRRYSTVTVIGFIDSLVAGIKTSELLAQRIAGTEEVDHGIMLGIGRGRRGKAL